MAPAQNQGDNHYDNRGDLLLLLDVRVDDVIPISDFASYLPDYGGYDVFMTHQI